MAYKYEISQPVPLLKDDSVTLNLGYFRGKCFEPPNGIDADGESLLAEIPKYAKWYRCRPNIAGVKWYVSSYAGREDLHKGIWFIGKNDEIILHHIPLYHLDTKYDDNDLVLKKGFRVPSGGPYLTSEILQYMQIQEVILGVDWVVWEGGVDILPKEISLFEHNGHRGYYYVVPMIGYSYWDGDLIVWTKQGVYNVAKKEIIYIHVSKETHRNGHASHDQIYKFIDGWVYFRNVHGHITDDNGYKSDPMYRIKVTRKVKKPTIPDCPICFEPKPNRMAYGCGHATICQDCDKKISQCPICTKTIDVRIKLFQ